MKRRMDSQDFVAMLKAKFDEVTSRLDSFLVRHDSSVEAGNVHRTKGTVSKGISEFVRQTGLDLVVMATVARSGVAGMIMGNMAGKMLDRIECSVLAPTPSNFVRPIQMED